MLEKWVRATVKSKEDNRVLHDANYLVCLEDFEVLLHEVFCLVHEGHKGGVTVEISEFWAPEKRNVRGYDSGNPFAIR